MFHVYANCLKSIYSVCPSFQTQLFVRMDVEQLEKLTILAKEIGLEGKELQDFIRDERMAYREKQQYDREREKERAV